MADEMPDGGSKSTPSLPRSRGAERMRRSRKRRKDGLRCLTIEIRDTEIDALVRRGLLAPADRNNRRTIMRALYAFLDDTLDRTP